MIINLAVFYALYFLAAALVYSAGIFLVKTPDYNFTVFIFGIFLIVGKQKFGKKTDLATLVLSCIVALLLFFPLKCISLSLVVVSIPVFVSLYFLTRPFAGHMHTVEKQELALSGRAEVLSRLKTVGKKQQDQEDELAGEIREISSIYTAVKDLSTTMTMDKVMGVISEILKKVIKMNFKIPLESINFVIVFKREFEYYIANSFGFDEEVLKSAEKQVVASILRNVSKSEELLYIPKTTDSGSIGDMMFLKSVVYMPFYVQKKLLGVILIAGNEEDLFTEKQIESLKLLSNQIAITMEKVHLYEEVQQMSLTDGLTGLTVHRHFQEKLEMELKRTDRYGGNLSVVMADIDFFKKVNDTYGHLAGDFILKTIALILKNHTASTDIVARYGGEEFVMVFPETDKDTAHMKAVKIRKDIESYKFVFGGQQIKVTMSMGVSGFPADGTIRRTLIEMADKALYKAKEEGRNRVIKAS